MYFMQVITLLHIGLVHGASLCLHGDFDSQVQTLLTANTLNEDDFTAISHRCEELQETLRSRWKDSDLFVYGSLPSGLGTKSSDVDFYLRIPDFNETAESLIMNETVKLFSQHPQIYRDVLPKPHNAIPIIAYYDVPLQRNIDVSFRISSGVFNSKYINYFMHLDNRILTLALIIKIWYKAHFLSPGHGLFSHYSTYLFVMFYMEQKKMGPTVLQAQADVPPHIVQDWNVNFSALPYKIDNQESLYELLGGFFKYYNHFDFNMNCVSPFVGRPVAKQDFKNIETIPREFTMYIDKAENNTLGTPLAVDHDICVQDIFAHNSNTILRARSETCSSFKYLVNRAAVAFDKVPREEYLNYILNENKLKERSVVEEYELEGDVILSSKRCKTTIK